MRRAPTSRPVLDQEGIKCSWLLVAWVMLGCAVAFSTRGLTSAEEGCQPVATNRPAGVDLRPSEVSHEGHFEFSETFDPNTYERREYVKRPGDKEPVFYYKHGRSIAPTMGHHRRLVLINDYSATKACNVIIADIETHKNWNIDSFAMEMYRKNANPDQGLLIVPEAYAFSPNDEEVLIGMDLIYVSAPTGELVRQVRKTYKRWWYVVNSSSGRVLHEYRTNQPPPCWWVN